MIVNSMTDDEFELLCHRATYLALLNNPARYYLTPVLPAYSKDRKPIIKCPCCEQTVEPDTPSFVILCPKCNTALLLTMPADVPPKKSTRKKKAS